AETLVSVTVLHVEDVAAILGPPESEDRPGGMRVEDRRLPSVERPKEDRAAILVGGDPAQLGSVGRETVSVVRFPVGEEARGGNEFGRLVRAASAGQLFRAPGEESKGEKAGREREHAPPHMTGDFRP